MYKYALVTKVDENLYETIKILVFPSTATTSIERIDAAINSEYPIVSMKTSDFAGKVQHGAEWTGADFIGWDEEKEKEMTEGGRMEYVNTWSLLSNNKIFFIITTPKNGSLDEMLEAAFGNEVTIVKINENEDVKVGDIWDGTEFKKAS